MATRRTEFTNVVGFTSLSFIRAQPIAFVCTGLKPNTRFYAFFDKKAVSQFCEQTGSSIGAPLISNDAGRLTGTFNLPGNTFNTGNRVFQVTDTELLEENQIPGSLVSSATAEFFAVGFQSTLQKTINETEEVTRRRELQTWSPQTIVATAAVPPAPAPALTAGRVGDPLAQTFFTYGVKGGCYVTKIEVWFQSKDANLPVVLELRHVDNGYPAFGLINQYASISKNPADVILSDDASASTVFEFSRPIYLEEDKDYCFVMLSNSNSYNMWTSEMGGVSIETGKAISEQPFIGSMFKSENNITWTAHQTEDIKFRLYTANFDVSSQRTLQLRAVAPLSNIPGTYLNTVSASPTVTVKFPIQHGFKSGDKFPMKGIPTCVYRGIPETALSKNHSVSVIDDYTFSFNVTGATATSSGNLASNGRVNYVYIDAGGTGYANPTAVVNGDGTGAAVSLTVDGGTIVNVTVTSMGSGYTYPPSIVVTDSVGSSGFGAVLVADTTALFSTTLNRKFQSVAPIIAKFEPIGTKITANIKTADFETSAFSETKQMSLQQSTALQSNNVLANIVNEESFFATSPSTEISFVLESDNPNVSPLIDMAATPRLRVENSIINDIYTNPASNYDPSSELSSSNGQAYARYTSKPVTVVTPSKGARVIVTAASTQNTWFEVYFRTSLSTAVGDHKSGNFIKMNCDSDRNLSSTSDKYIDYEFYIDDISQFDTYDLKIVLSSKLPQYYPVIDNYRVIIIAV